MQSSWVPMVLVAVAAVAAAVLLVVSIPPELKQGEPAVEQPVAAEPLVLDGIPDIPDALLARMDEYAQIAPTQLGGWLPEGGVATVPLGSDTPQLHVVRNPGESARPLTRLQGAVGVVRINPNPDVDVHIVGEDVDGSGRYQLYAFRQKSNTLTALPSPPSSHSGMGLWSPDGGRYVFSGDARNGNSVDLYIVYHDQPQAVEVLAQGGRLYPVDWAADGQSLLVWDAAPANSLKILDVNTGELREASRRLPGMNWARLSKDGEGLYIITFTDYWRLSYFDFATNSSRILSVGISAHIRVAALSPSKEYLAFVANQGGVSALYVLETATNTWRRLHNAPSGIIGSLRFHPHEDRLAFVLDNAQSPGEVYSVHLSDQSLTQWTFAESDTLDASSFALPQLIEYETFDEVLSLGEPRTIPAFYYAPVSKVTVTETSARESEPHPVLIYLHDGPSQQFVPRYDPLLQYVVNELGVAVVAPNVRGSSGYDEVYRHMDNILKREDAVKDVGKLLDWIAEQPELDATRVAVIGQSYGGYLALASLIHFGDRLRAGASAHGYLNLMTMLRNVSGQAAFNVRFEYGEPRFESTVAFLNDISPVNRLESIQAPLFIVQGGRDRVVPLRETEQLLNAVRGNGFEVWYMLGTQAGHGFSNRDHLKQQQAALVLFLQKHLIEVSEGE